MRDSLSQDRIWTAFVVGVYAAWGWWTSVPVPSADFWWHLALGRDILAEGSVPIVDAHSWVQAGTPFFDQPWLSQLVYVALHRWGGLQLIIFVTGVALALTGWLLCRACVQATGDRRTAAAVLVFAGIPAMTENWLVRPQTLAYPLFATMLVLAAERRVTTWRLAAAFMTMAIWTNVHGSFVLGLVLVLAALAHEAGRGMRGTESGWRRVGVWAAMVGATVAGTVVNPRGVGVYSYVLNLTSSDAVRAHVSEWQRASLDTLSGRMALLLLALWVLGLLLHRRRPEGFHVLLALGFGVLALTAGRHIVWFVMVAMLPVAAAYSSGGSQPEARASRPWLRLALAAVVTVGLVVALPWTGVSRRAAPDDALTIGIPSPSTLTALSEIQPERLFNESGYGSYLMWYGQRVFFDPRFEFYASDHVDEYFAISAGESFDVSTQKWRFDAMLVSKTMQPRLVALLEDSPSWRLVTEDDDAMLFTPR